MSDAHSSNKFVVVIGLGGTIAMAQLEAARGVVPSLTAKDLIASVPELANICKIETYNFLNVPSVELQLNDMVYLANEIRNWELKGAAGVVVLQGTDTIEETSWCLDLLLQTEMPVIVTGAMRNPTSLGADGPANLLAAVQVASCKNAQNKGVLVVFNDEIHSARFVVKTNTSSTAAFQSPNAGRVGWVTEGSPSIFLSPMDFKPILISSDAKHNSIALISTGIGDDGKLIDLLTEAGFDGLVIEATGGGHTSFALAKSIERAVKNMPVILASRTGSGQILSNTYGFPGSEKDLLSKGVISAGMLSGPKARVLLLCLLASNCSKNEIHLEMNKRSTLII